MLGNHVLQNYCFKEFYLNCFEILISQDVSNNVGEGADISNDKTSISDSALRTYFNSTELLQEVNSKYWLFTSLKNSIFLMKK